MIDIVDATFKDSPTQLMVEVPKLLAELPLKGVNWWNSNNFPLYLKNVHKNPWEILETLQETLDKTTIIIDVKGNQLNKSKIFSEEIIDKFLSQFSNSQNIQIKIYDPLNDISKIEKILLIATKYKLKVIGGILLRPEIKDFPECHSKLIHFYKDQGIKYLSLIEPLGLLKSGDIKKVKELLDNTLENYHSNVSFKHMQLQQSLLVQEAIICGINEFDFSLASHAFGYPSLEVIYNSVAYLNKPLSEVSLPVQSYFKLMESLKNNNLIPLSKETFNFNYLEKTDFPVEVYQSVKNLSYFTNLTHDFPTIISTIKIVQDELGNPPLIDPFLTIIISQAVFRLQNSNKGIETLDTLKYISGYWGKPVNSLKGEFKDFSKISDHLVTKTKLFSPMNQFQEKELVNLEHNHSEIQTERDKLLFILSPEEANYYFREFEPRPKSIDYRNRKSLASLVKTILETEKQHTGALIIRNEPQLQQETGEFRWRYLSRMFQIGKF